MINSNPKTVFEPDPNPKNSSLGPKKPKKTTPKFSSKKPKMIPKFDQIKESELKES